MLKRMARRSGNAPKALRQVPEFPAPSLTACLDDCAKDLGYRDWEHLSRCPNPEACEDDPFRVPPEEPKLPGDAVSALCSVDGCGNRADYRVLFYDYYAVYDEVFCQGDYTCPFLCTEHVTENEARAFGLRRPRKSVTYPYTNRQHGIGYTLYQPIRTEYRPVEDDYQLVRDEYLPYEDERQRHL